MKYIPCEQDAWTEATKRSKQTKKVAAALPRQAQRMKCEMDNVRKQQQLKASSSFKVLTGPKCK